ncbi:MAG: dipicolinate synthase subunit B [Oscillospiraceae bacterium]|jgi:dipicolinate synthase subunit B|nr:dipicolinate synthase subunit B [Oscillospiraceae bacterium]
MELKNARIGVGLTGSFCTFADTFAALAKLKERCASLTFVLSYHVQTLSCRFTTPDETLRECRELSDVQPILTIPDAEPLGPKNKLDLFLIAPCTGNTLAKLAHGITDTPVLMAAKGHLRGGKPLVLAVASNDALSANMTNIGTLMRSKNIYFVPLTQDSPAGKPFSLVADLAQLTDTVAAALKGKQIQPILHPGL